jgi:hypothetical protein
MNTTNSKVVGQQTMTFSPEERAAAVQRLNTQQKRVNPQTQGARAVVKPPMPPAPATPSPRIQRQNSGRTPDPTQVDPALLDVLSGQSNQQGGARSTGAPGINHNPLAQPQQQDPEWYQTPRPRPMAAPVDEPVVANPMPGYVVPLSDAAGSSLALPSHFGYYDFKDLYVRPFKNGHLAKLSRAKVEGTLQPMVETVSTVIYSSDPQYKNLAFDLTMPDFFFVMYWLRLNSYTKASFLHKDVCNNPEHREKVVNKELAPDTLELKRVIDKTQLVTHELEVIPDPKEFNLGEDSIYELNPPRMRDVLEFMDHPYMSKPELRVEFSYLAQQAAHIRLKAEYKEHPDHYASLEQRIDYIENLALDKVELVKRFEKLMKGYGVEESVTMNCRVCGASRASKIVLGASSFLSFD